MLSHAPVTRGVPCPKWADTQYQEIMDVVIPMGWGLWYCLDGILFVFCCIIIGENVVFLRFIPTRVVLALYRTVGMPHPHLVCVVHGNL